LKLAQNDVLAPIAGLDFGRLIYLRDLVRELVIRDIKLRYKRSMLGVGWSLLVPLSQLLILSFVFRVVVPLNIPDYTLFLFSGLLPWTWFQSSLMAATRVTLDNRELIRQVGFPVRILPVITVTSQLVHFLLALPLLLLFVWLERGSLTGAILVLPLVVGLQFVLILSIAYLVAPLQAIFHDTEHLLGIFLMLLFYLTPVFYNPTAIPARYAWVFNLNPLVPLLDAYRQVLVHGELPAAMPLLVLGGVSAMLFAAGIRGYMCFHYRFVQEL
jgi:lipopolysaccharide transport system permease protein